MDVHIPPEPDIGPAYNKVVARACNFCRAAHISCETARPCQRCVRLGRGEWCCDVPANKRGRPPIHGRRSAQYQEQQRQKKKQKMQQQPQPQPQLHTPKLEPPDNDQQADDGLGRAARAPPEGVEPPLRVRPPPAPTPAPAPVPLPALSSRRSPSPPPLPSSSSSSFSSASFFQATNTKLDAFFSALPATATSATSATTTVKRSPSSSSPPPSSSSSFSLAPQPTSPRQLPLPAGNGASGSEHLAALVAQLMVEVRTLREANESLQRDNANLRRRLDALESQQTAHAHRVDSLLEFGAARSSLRSNHDAPRLQGQTTTPFVTCAHGLEGAWSHLLFTPPASTTIPSSASSRSPRSSFSSSSSSSSTESLSPRSSFSLERSVLQSSLVASQQALDEMQRHVPLLRHYYVAPKDFAVQDIRYPVYVLAPTPGGNCACPVIKWVNEAFVSLSGYTIDKLMEMPLSKLFSSQKSQTAQLAASLFNQCPMSVSGTFALHPLLRQRNGCTVRIDEVNQFFYGQHGAVSFSVTCILGWQADSLRPDEQFGQWLPELLRLT